MQDNNNCTTLSCGKVTGDLGTSNTVSNIIHYIGMVYDYGGTDTLDSTNVLGSGTLSLNYSLNDSTTCSSLSGRPFVFDSDISECTLIFEKSWRKYGYGYNADSGLNYYKSGSLIEPFEINNADDWNNIGTDIFLVQKAFVLTSDIDFAGGFNPIGTNDNTNIDQVFNGIIIPDGHKIFNITYTTPSGGSETSGGLFPVTGPDARIGLFYDPLRVENVNLTADANKSGIIGESQGGEVAIHAKYISIDGSATNSVGGLVGYVSGSDLRLENSFFHGEIDINTAIGLGGLVGEVQNATGEVSIKESFADVSFLRGADSVGGIIGLTNAPGKIQLENVYSWIDKDGVHAGDDIVAVGGSNFSAGIFGNATSCGSNVSLKNIYTHIDTATLGAGFNRLVNGGTVCSIPTSGFIGAVDSSATADGSFVTPTAYNTTALLYSGESVDSEDKWVLFNGELVLDWQVNGLED